MEKQENQEEDRRIISIDKAVKRSPRAETGISPGLKEDRTQPAPGSEGGELSEKELTGIVEALLFATPSPLSPSRINDLTGIGGTKKTESLLQGLKEKYEEENRPCFLQEVAGGYQLRTRPQFDPWVSKLRSKQQQDTLSRAALETLSIIAYRQPITRAQIEDIRGVQSGYILRSLIEKSLVKVTGRSDELGRPLLYATTKKFLEVFGLASLKDLPALP